jgi:hypothetical protein
VMPATTPGRDAGLCAGTAAGAVLVGGPVAAGRNAEGARRRHGAGVMSDTAPTRWGRGRTAED